MYFEFSARRFVCLYLCVYAEYVFHILTCENLFLFLFLFFCLRGPYYGRTNSTILVKLPRYIEGTKYSFSHLSPCLLLLHYYSPFTFFSFLFFILFLSFLLFPFTENIIEKQRKAQKQKRKKLKGLNGIMDAFNRI